MKPTTPAVIYDGIGDAGALLDKSHGIPGADIEAILKSLQALAVDGDTFHALRASKSRTTFTVTAGNQDLSTTLNIPGVAMNDFAFVSVKSVSGAELTLDTVRLTAYVSAQDTVQVSLFNHSADTDVVFPAVVFNVLVIPLAEAQRFGLVASTTVDLASVALGAQGVQSITVTGAAMGDYAAFSAGVDLGGLVHDARITAANTVTVLFFNPDTAVGAVNLASTRFCALVLPQDSVAHRARNGSVVWNPANIVDHATAETTVLVPGAMPGDIAQPSFSLDNARLQLQAHIPSQGVVKCRLFNESGGAVNLAEGVLKVQVWPAAALVVSDYIRRGTPAAA